MTETHGNQARHTYTRRDRQNSGETQINTQETAAANFKMPPR